MAEPTGVADNLKLAKANYVQQLADLSNPRAIKTTYSVGGRSFSWVEHQRFLLDMIAALDAQIAANDDGFTGDLITAVQ